MLILLTNDDGHRAQGLAAARAALQRVGDVVTVAPAREMSGVSHAITLGRPLAVERVGEAVHAVEGTPADCVTLALHGLLPRKPDVLVSGINHGPNLGDDVTYSGTVGAAVEGALQGVPSLAVSQLMDDSGADFSVAGRLAARLAGALGGGRVVLPEGTLLSLNVPAHPADEPAIELASLARRRYLEPVDEQRDDEGRTYFWLGGRPVWSREEGTDHEVVTRRGRASLTLLRTSLDAEPDASVVTHLAAVVDGLTGADAERVGARGLGEA